jgi:hypothetical protein
VRNYAQKKVMRFCTFCTFAYFIFRTETIIKAFFITLRIGSLKRREKFEKFVLSLILNSKKMLQKCFSQQPIGKGKSNVEKLLAKQQEAKERILRSAKKQL